MKILTSYADYETITKLSPSSKVYFFLTVTFIHKIILLFNKISKNVNEPQRTRDHTFYRFYFMNSCKLSCSTHLRIYGHDTRR